MFANSKSTLLALSNAENGLKKAKIVLLSVLNSGTNLSSLYSSNNGVFLTSFDAAGNGYSVSILDNDYGDPISSSEQSVVLKATGTSDKVSRVLESIIVISTTKSNSDFANAALLVNGPLELSGNSDITGSCGAIQVNGELSVFGSTYVNLSVSASGGIINPEKLDSPSIDGSAEPVSVPKVSPENYRYLADYILSSNGKVYDASGGEISDTASNKWNGWQKTGENNGITQWKLSGNTTLSSVTLYVEGEVEVSGSPGKGSSDGWKVSLIAERSIHIQGNPQFTPNDSSTSFAGMKNLLFVAGGDLKISGNATHLGDEGFYLAHEQIEFSGNSTIKGLVVAENATTASNHQDHASVNTISGNSDFNNDTGCSDSSDSTQTMISLSTRSQVEVKA